MATLRFFAAADALVPERDTNGGNLPVIVGQPMRYVGRDFDPNPKVKGAFHPASQEPYTCESATGEAAYLASMCRIGALHAADDDTAKFCGVPKADVEFSNGVWMPRAQSAGKAE